MLLLQFTKHDEHNNMPLLCGPCEDYVTTYTYSYGTYNSTIKRRVEELAISSLPNHNIVSGVSIHPVIMTLIHTK